MKIKKIKVNEILIIFLSIHLFIWTFIPSISNNNLPLDTIEALAWGSNLDWGFNKHPPLSAFAVEIFYKIFGSQDWAYYFLSQLFVVSAFFIVFKFSEDFFKNQQHGLISILLLEGIYFYNFTSPEFNVNVCQLPFWSLSVLYLWKGYKNNKDHDWLLFGLFAALGILSKYLFLYLLLAMDIFFIYLIVNKKFNYKSCISLITFFLVLLPHLIWLVNNDYITLVYGLHRTGTGEQTFLDHFVYPLIFLGKQIGILIPFFIMFLFLVVKFKKKFNIPKFKIKFNLRDDKLIFLLIINIVPIFLMFLTSMILGVKIRTMWMTPFYLFSGILLVYIFNKYINLKKIKYFFLVFLILFIFSPTMYLFISITQTEKRTDYHGKEIANIVQKKWNNNFKNTIASVIGDEWHAGNLSYYLQSHPKWYSYSAAFVDKSVDDFIETIGKKGFIIVNGECPYGISFLVENNKICMSGDK